MKIDKVTDKNKREDNQDSYISGQIDNDIVLGVFDGIGGLEHGEDASSTLRDNIQSTMADRYSLVDVLTSIKDTSYELYHRPYKTGTTMVLGVFNTENRELTIVSCGDSRLYVSSDDVCAIDSFKQFSIDDTWSNLLPNTEMGQSARGKSVLRYAIGTEETPSIRVSKYNLSSASCVNLLLATDGFWHTLQHQINQGISAPIELGSLVELAKNLGESDNITAVLGTQL